MTKQEAIEKFVNSELQAIPQSWIRTIADSKNEYPNLPMWGTMWLVDSYIGEKLLDHSRVMAASEEDINVDDIEDSEERARVTKAIDDDNDYLEDYIDEEMAYEHCVLDKDGNTTALFIYEIDDEYVIGVNGAGWNFYDGVWNKLYDLLGYQWHETEAKVS